MVATWTNLSKLSEAKEVRSKAAEVEMGEGNCMFAALTEQVACLMTTLDIKNSSSGNPKK